MANGSAVSSCPIAFAFLFAVSSVTYALIFSKGILFGIQSYRWHELDFKLPGQLKPSQEDLDDWVMSTNTFRPNEYQTYPYVANGYFGQSLPAEGSGYWIQKNESSIATGWSLNNWPLDEARATFGTVAGFYDCQDNINRIIWPPNLERGCESVISGIPDWTGLVITTARGESYLPGVHGSSVKEYHQSMSLRNGIVRTNITWKPTGEQTSFRLNFTVLAHQESLNLGVVRLDILVDYDTIITATDVLDGSGAARTTFSEKSVESSENMIWTSVKPLGLDHVLAYEYSTVALEMGSQQDLENAEASREIALRRPWISQNESTVAQSWNLTVKAGRPVTIYKYVGIASSDAFQQSAQSVARNTALAAKRMNWEDLVKSHNEAWDDLWDGTEIAVPGNEEIHTMAKASLFHLLTNLRPGTERPGLGDNSISPSGLSSDSYGGYVFWDADIWVNAPLLTLYPDRARNINNYRSKMHEQAIKNAKVNEFMEFSGALYPWTSGRFGNCTGNGICAGYQYHINADIAMAHWHYFLYTGDIDWLREKAWPIIFNAAEMFVSFVQVSLNYSQGRFWTIALTDPDEDAVQVNDGAYTNTAIKLLLGTWAPTAAKLLNTYIPSSWEEIAANITIPFNTNGDLIKEYSGMLGDIIIKQADVILINYPLDYEISSEVARNNLEYYAIRNSPLGPQMTWSAHSVSESQLQLSGCSSYTYLLYSSIPYLRPPFYQFSELLVDDASLNGGTLPAFPFLTGHGAFLQIFTHGLTGMRPRYDAFYLDPSLPPQLGDGGIQVRGMKWQGAIFDVDIQLENTTIWRRKPRKSYASSRKKAVTIRIGGNNLKSGDYRLKIGESLTVPTRRPDLNTGGNHALCKSILSSDGYTTGHFPLSAVDGSVSTVWQPTSSHQPAELIVDLGLEFTSLSKLEINWAAVPSQGFKVEIAGENWETVNENFERSWREILKVDNVDITAPFEPERVKEVKMAVGNVTIAALNKRFKARYIKLVIWGTQGVDKDVGATVAEFKVY